ncbi:MAG: hypothetical protein ABI835_12985 [Chloroflexota bacterium]
MQPGLSRAIPMGIIGFIVGALLVIILRGLQSLDPLWATGPGIVLSVIMTAIFFVWGMGAFDPRLSIHGDEAAEEAVHEELAKEAEKPTRILTSSVWQLVTIVVILSVILGGFAALPGGLALTQTIIPGASPTMVGYASIPLPFGGPDVQVSTLVIFAVFVIWAFISLAAVAWVFAWALTSLSNGLVEVKAAGSGAGTLALSAPAGQAPAERDNRRTFIAIAQFIVVTIVLYALFFIILGALMPTRQLPVLSWFMDSAGQLTFLSFVFALAVAVIVLRPPLAAPAFLFTFIILYYFFYYVAIGLILPAPELPGLSMFLTPAQTLIFLSLVNAILFTFLILHTQLVLHTIGRVAGWLARVLRSVPRFLQ